MPRMSMPRCSKKRLSSAATMACFTPTARDLAPLHEDPGSGSRAARRGSCDRRPRRRSRRPAGRDVCLNGSSPVSCWLTASTSPKAKAVTARTPRTPRRARRRTLRIRRLGRGDDAGSERFLRSSTEGGRYLAPHRPWTGAFATGKESVCDNSPLRRLAFGDRRRRGRADVEPALWRPGLQGRPRPLGGVARRRGRPLGRRRARPEGVVDVLPASGECAHARPRVPAAARSGTTATRRSTPNSPTADLPGRTVPASEPQPITPESAEPQALRYAGRNRHA